MATVLAEDRLVELDRKLNFLVEELSSLKRLRNSAEDLAADLSLVGKSAMRDAVEAFGTADLHPPEIASLLKSVLANARLFENAIIQLQSTTDFIQDAQPILRDAMMKAVTTAESLSQKGYFIAARSAMRVGDALVHAHSASDWRQIEASAPQFVGFLRELTRPEVLQALESIIHGFGRVQVTMDVDKSFLAIARDLRSAEARRGMAILVEFLKVVGARSMPAPSGNKSDSPTPER